MSVPEQCVVRQTEATHNVEGFDGSKCTAERDHRASTPAPAGGVDLGFGGLHADPLLVSQQQ